MLGRKILLMCSIRKKAFQEEGGGGSGSGDGGSKAEGEETDRKKLAIKRDMLSKKKAVTVTTDPNKMAKKTDPKKPAIKRDHQEISAPGLDSMSATTSTITTVSALMNGGNGDGGDDVTIEDEGNGDNSDRDDDTFEDNDGDSDHTRTDKDDNPQLQSSGDTAIQHRVMKEKKVESFKDLNDVNVIIDAYECLTGNCLCIKKSQKDKYRVYQCCLHVGCPFQVRFSKPQADNLYVLSVMKTNHSTVSRPNCAVDGRKLKKRRQGRLDAVVVCVLQTKERDPTPGEIMKTAGGKSTSLMFHTWW